MSSLPSNWVVAPLGDLLSDVLGGGTPDKSKAENFRGDIPFMTVKDMHSRFINDTKDHISQEALASSASRVIPADTLVIASRMSLGKIARPTRPVAINQDLKALFLHQGVSKPYIEYAWRANAARIQAMGTGTTVKGIRLEDIRGLKVPVAPTAEQTRIADQLDTLLARIQACQDRLEAVPALLQRFRRTILGAATTGELTEDWRASNPETQAAPELAAYLAQRSLSDKRPVSEPDLRYWHAELPATWIVASVHQFAECLDRFRVPVKKDARKASLGLYPYYGANGEVGRIDDFLFDDELVLVTEDETFYGRTKPIAYRSSGKCWVNNHAHVLRAPTKEANDYLCYSLMHYDVIPWLTGTTGRAKLTQQALNSLPIAVPPASEISEIVRRVEALLKLAASIEAKCAAATKHATRLSPLALAKAFRGELVPQDPTDEPASALLARIGARRNAPTDATVAPTPRRGRPPRAPKEIAAMTKSRQDDDVMGQPYLAGHLRRIGTPASAEALFKVAELPVADFYKQLAWEVAHGHVKDNQTTLEPGHAAG